MIEPYNYCVIDTFYNWELYAQNNDYAKECEVLETEGLRKKLLSRNNIVDKVIK